MRVPMRLTSLKSLASPKKALHKEAHNMLHTPHARNTAHDGIGACLTCAQMTRVR